MNKNVLIIFILINLIINSHEKCCKKVALGVFQGKGRYNCGDGSECLDPFCNVFGCNCECSVAPKPLPTHRDIKLSVTDFKFNGDFEVSYVLKF